MKRGRRGTCDGRRGGLLAASVLALLPAAVRAPLAQTPTAQTPAAQMPTARSQAAAPKPPKGLFVRDIGGRRHDLLEKGRTAVLVFISSTCPISNRYAPEVNRISAGHGGPKFAFYIVYVEPGLTARAAREHAAAYGYRCPALLDARRALVQRTGVTVTPEVAVLRRDAKPGAMQLLYRGRIDDRHVALGKMRAQPTRRDLRLALDAIAKGQPVTQPRTQAIGCFIPSHADEKRKIQSVRK